MDDSQQAHSQSQSQSQHRTRNRLTDANTSRRPRAVAGQRAAAKRAGQVVPRTQAEPAPTVQPVDADNDVNNANNAVEVAEPIAPIPPAESVDSAAPAAPSDSAAPIAPIAPIESVEPLADSPEPAPRTNSPQSRKTRRAIVTAVLAVALIAALAAGAVFAVQDRDVIRTDHARTAAMAAAERAAPVIFSYDYRHLDQDFAKAETLLTGSFRDQYAKTTQTVVKPTALQYHGVVKATVARPTDGSAAAVSVVSASPDQVVVLAFINQSTTSTRVNGTQVDQNRVLLTLTHTPQGWRVSAVGAF